MYYTIKTSNKLEIRNDSIRAGLLLSNTDAGATNSPAIDYYRNSASAAASDVLGITTSLWGLIVPLLVSIPGA